MFGRDNPGGEWLRNKRERAEDWASRNPRGATGKMISGAVTAYTRKAVMIDLSALAGLRGACDENRRPGDARYDELMLDVEKDGWDRGQVGNAILIGVNQNGVPYIVEGNTRVAVASDIGETEIRAEIRWYNGGEQEPGPFSLAEGNSLPFCREEDDNLSPSP